MFPYADNIPHERTPLVTIALIVINALALFGTIRLPDARQTEVAYEFGFVPARLAQLENGQPLKVEVPDIVEVPPFGFIEDKRVLVLPADRAAVLVTIVTSMFMHGGWLHLLGNMWFLWLFGNNVEDRLGHVGFLVFYLLGGVAALACQWVSDPTSVVPVIGASGAVAAVLGGYAVTWPHARVRALVVLFIFITTVELPALLFLGGWFVLQLFQASQPDEFGMAEGVAWWAHIGGFVAGLATMLVLNSLRSPPAAAERFEIGEW